MPKTAKKRLSERLKIDEISVEAPQETLDASPTPAKAKKQARTTSIARREPISNVPSKDVAVKNLENLIGDDLIPALEASPDPRAARILSRRLDPAYHNVSLAKLLSDENLTARDIYDVFRDYKQAEALIIAARYIPDVMAGIGEDALTKRYTCIGCNGAGVFEVNGSEKVCAMCSGTGERVESGDKNARDQILEAVDILGRTAPLISITKNTQNNNIVNMSTIDDILKGSDDTADDIIEAELTDM